MNLSMVALESIGKNRASSFIFPEPQVRLSLAVLTRMPRQKVIQNSVDRGGSAVVPVQISMFEQRYPASP